MAAAHLPTVADLEARASRIADPMIDFKAKYTAVCEIKEMLDAIRDSDSGRILPQMIPAVLDLLKTGQVTFQKDSPEYQFRRGLLEILHRIPATTDAVRAQSPAMFSGMLNVIRHDNEENGATACKILLDLIRNHKLVMTETLLQEFISVFQESFLNMRALVDQLLSEDSPQLDPQTLLPGIRSFKTLAEMGLIMVIISQIHRPLVTTSIQAIMASAMDLLSLESPAQKKAREDYEAMGGYWAGMAPTIKNAATYGEFLNAQVKMVSFMAYIMRWAGDQYESYGDPLTLIALRILQDLPSNNVALRKELMVVFRHLMGSAHRQALLPHLDKMYNERVVLGSGLTSREVLRANIFSAIADLMHHLRNELTSTQLARVIQIYSRLIHNPAVMSNLHTLYAKMMFNLVDVVVTKENSQQAIKIVLSVFEVCISRLESLAIVLQQVTSNMEMAKNGVTDFMDPSLIERARPIGGAAYALDKGEDIVTESRLIFRAVLHGFRVCLTNLRKCSDGRVVDLDGTLIFRLFDTCLRCMAHFVESDVRPNEPNDIIDWFCAVLLEINLHIFQEVWTHKIELFFECAQKKIVLLNICQALFSREPCSPTLLAIVLEFLLNRLPLLGEQDDLCAAATIRFFRLAFSAVASQPATNEPILASHIGKLLMDCFPLAAKATKPSHYFHLLRALFRAIGSGGGRYELLYKEVLPLLPEMLENLNRQLLTTEGATRDLIVELCLTVPLRLTHLLPHLTYLMHPLVLALRGTTELVTQGLRTLELCIDNLTPDFLDPTLNTVLRDLMDALHQHLKPQPANHTHSHVTVRILGKLGGRNRRLLNKDPVLNFKQHTHPVCFSVSLGGIPEKLDLGPTCALASRVLKNGTLHDRMNAYNYLESFVAIILQEGVTTQNVEDALRGALEGLFDAIHVAELQDQSEELLRKVARIAFESELRPTPQREQDRNLLLTAYLDAFSQSLLRDQLEHFQKAQTVTKQILSDLAAVYTTNNNPPKDMHPLLVQLSSRYCTLCLDESWSSKRAGCSGIKAMITTSEFNIRWVVDGVIDLVRTLLHVLKDLSPNIPHDVDEVLDVLYRVIRVSSTDLHNESSESNEKVQLNFFHNLACIFFTELSHSNSIVRNAVHSCIALMEEIGRKTAYELLLPHRKQTLPKIYSKPLRALPFPNQIGMIEAIRYCMSTNPPLVELSEVLLRLLHESLALADAEDASLLGRNTARQNALEVIKLRVACIKLLTASMPLTDFFSKQPQTRQRVTGVYFKSLYSVAPEVKDVAHEGLKTVLAHQSRLPKELLQTGLRPILMNLADPKRLSVPGLEGLARLLELLNSYFKVEIGHKLLDHFRVLADSQMLQASARLPLRDNEGIMKLARLANIFHLLPSAANMFLENLINAIVQTETTMHFSSRSPFSEPLAKYLDRYPVEGADYFLRHLNYPRYLRTLRSILQADLAPKLAREFMSRTTTITSNFLRGTDPTFVMPCLHLFSDLADIQHTWLAENPCVIEALLEVWQAERVPPSENAVLVPETNQRHSVMLGIFIAAMKQSPRIDLLFDISAIYTRNLAMDQLHVTNFLYSHVAFSHDLLYRRNVLMRFLTWFEDAAYSWSHKAYFIRYIVTPTLLVEANRSPDNNTLLDAAFVDRVHRIIWRPITENVGFSETDDMFKIELLHLTTVMVQHYPHLLEDAKKDVIKCAWHYIQHSEDMIVKQTAYLLSARFFVAFPTPQKFIIRSWTGLLRPPPTEGRPALRQEALSTIAPILPNSDPSDSGYPLWAKTTRRLMSDEGMSPLLTIYQLIVKMPHLFYPVRALFVPHMVNSLNKLGLNNGSTQDSRMLTVEMLQVIFDWEQKAAADSKAAPDGKDAMIVDDAQKRQQVWNTPLGFRENIVSYLVRLATQAHDTASKSPLVPRTLALIQLMMHPAAWSDVTVGLRFFMKALENNDLNNESAISQAIASAKVVQVITAEQTDSWYINNAGILHQLVRKGMLTDEALLHDALHPIFDRLIQLFPLPKEEEEFQHEQVGNFHSFVSSSILNGLRNGTSVRGTILMLKSVLQASPERGEAFSAPLCKLLGKLSREHLQASIASPGYDNGVRLITALLELCVSTIAYHGENRKIVISSLCYLGEKSKSSIITRATLEIASAWIFSTDVYPSVKDKIAVVQRLAALDSRADPLSAQYSELIFKIYTEPSLRRSEVTMRLESSFLLGCRAKDPSLRERFTDLYDMSLPRSLNGRLTFILGVQSWEPLAEHNWIFLAVHLLLGAINFDTPLLTERKATTTSAISALAGRQKVQNIVQPMQRLLFLDPQAAHECWISVFPAAWSCLSKREQSDLTLHMITLLSKEYHIKQAEMRPNVIQTLLAGVHACNPPMILPPHLVKYLSKTFGAWHTGLEIMTSAFDHLRDDDLAVRDYVYDSLADIYAELSETDMFYGLWRKRSLHPDTNMAIAFEQNGMWEQAANAYELAQTKARTGAIAFSEPEYCLWEDHWIESAKKLQQWEGLYDLAKNDGDISAMLEAAWACKNWTEEREQLDELVGQLPDTGTPRHRVFEAFMALLKLPSALDKNVEFNRIHDDAVQLSLRKWAALPPPLSAAHVPLLQHFQQLVELQEAVQIFGSLSTTNGQNLEKKSSELKMVLQAWRERLPNLHDDISIWSDLVAWRQNVFHAINKAYVPLIPPVPAAVQAGATSTTNTFGYRGYHETAWIINRFAHVARKHDLLDVCFTQLNKIYTLPNIEISEAFLKLREQARCYYQKPNELQSGLEVINSTNLHYFSVPQKVEFFTLKGMFIARLGREEEANDAFSKAVQFDLSQPKAWAEWGKFSDRLFHTQPNEMTHAANAVRCYFNAVGGYKSGKCRPLLIRILWLLSVDDASYTIARAFDSYKGDAAFWFWIPLIPQLCLSLSYREVKQARNILLNLAKLYPQALFYHLRATKEEIAGAKIAAMLRAKNQNKSPGNTSLSNESPSRTSAANVREGSNEAPKDGMTLPARPMSLPQAILTAQATVPEVSTAHRQPAEHIDEVLQILKTAFPLLSMTMECMVDQIQQRFRFTTEEERYRQFCMLIQEAITIFVVRANDIGGDKQITDTVQLSIKRAAITFVSSPQAYAEFEEEFLKPNLTVEEYIIRLQRWRDKYERIIDARPPWQPLDILSHYLTEFQYNKVDEIEVPGQYTEDKDNNQNFVKIQKFGTKFENCRSYGSSWKRIILHGSDSSRTAFSVQIPSNRITRREERVFQVLRMFNSALLRKKETRKRNLTFHVPATVACGASIRLHQTDSSYISLGDIFDRYCAQRGYLREDPIISAGRKVRDVLADFHRTWGRPAPKKDEYLILRKDIFDEIVAKMVPIDILSDYMLRTMETSADLWRMRKQFTLQWASCSFVTYIFLLGSRAPARFHVSRATGLIAMSDIVPAFHNERPIFFTTDVVPFRFTPNVQHFIGPIGTEGLLTSSIMAIGRSLTEPEFELAQQLALFARDEVAPWMATRKHPWTADSVRSFVATLLKDVVDRAEAMACKKEREQAGNLGTVPVVQTVTNLISSATNPVQLTKMGDLFLPWF